MASLYELNSQLQAIDNLLVANENEETQEILESAKEELLKDIDSKMVSICEYMNDCDGKIAQYKEEIARLQAKVKSLSNKKEFLKNLCKYHLIETGTQKAEYGTFTLSIAKTPAKVVLADDAEALLPDNLCTITRVANKTNIKDAMVDGKYSVIVDGHEVVLATLDQTGTTLRIK